MDGLIDIEGIDQEKSTEELIDGLIECINHGRSTQELIDGLIE